MTKKKLASLIECVDKDCRPVAEGIIDEITFLQGVLKKLKQAIKEQGVTATYSTGAPRESPALKSYNATIQRYSTLCKQIELMIRNGNQIETGENALQSWLAAQK